MRQLWAVFKVHPYIGNVLGYTVLFASADLIQQSLLGDRAMSASIDRVEDEKAVGDLKTFYTTFLRKFGYLINNRTPGGFWGYFPNRLYLTSPTRTALGPFGTKATVKGFCREFEFPSGSIKYLSIDVSYIPLKTSGIDWHQMARVATVGFCFHANFNYHWLKALEKMLPGGGAKMVSAKVVLDQLIAAPLTISAFYIGLSFLENKEDMLEEWRQTFWTSYKAGVVYWSTMQAINFTLVPPVARTVFLGGIALTFTIFLCHMKRQGDQRQ